MFIKKVCPLCEGEPYLSVSLLCLPDSMLQSTCYPRKDVLNQVLSQPLIMARTRHPDLTDILAFHVISLKNQTPPLRGSAAPVDWHLGPTPHELFQTWIYQSMLSQSSSLTIYHAKNVQGLYIQFWYIHDRNKANKSYCDQSIYLQRYFAFQCDHLQRWSDALTMPSYGSRLII